jgi:hypothetical protein
MDSTGVLPKLSASIQAISSCAESACVNVQCCQTLAAAIRNLTCLINEIQEAECPIVGDAIVALEGLDGALTRTKGVIVKFGRETSRLYAASNLCLNHSYKCIFTLKLS